MASLIATQELGPPDITCPDYAPRPGSKRCRDYQPGGLCDRPNQGMCVEWLRVNGHPVPARNDGSSDRRDEAAGFDVFGQPRTAARRSRQPATRSIPTSPGPAMETERAIAAQAAPARRVTADEIAGFQALGVEVCVSSPRIGDVWLVGAYTGRRDRQELTPEHAMTIASVIEAFPGAQVASFEALQRAEVAS